MKRDHTLTWTAPAALDFTGVGVAVIGGTGGIGRALAKALAGRGASVTVVGRKFRDHDVPGLRFVAADLASMTEARHIGETLPIDDLDLVVFTTGIMAGPVREVTPDGLERDLAVSWLSRLAILRALAPRLTTGRLPERPKPRVFVMGFPGSGQRANVVDLNSERSYGRMTAHMTTVAGNEALVVDAARRYPDLLTFGLNPGFVKTGIRTNLFGGRNWLYRLVEGLAGLATRTAEDYARTTLPLLSAPELEGRSGAMFDSRGRAILPSKWTATSELDAVITASEELLRRASPAGA